MEDLPILCHRHTTSKLKEYEDLETLDTLGFRGEALCSISFVSHMTVTTMIREQEHGWRVTYKDGEVEPPGPRPIAAVPGTTITVEDLFYNVPTRKKALKSGSEEYNQILDVVNKYAVYRTGVGLTCKRQGEPRTDLHTVPTASRLENIRSVYGAAVAKDLISLDMRVGDGIGPSVPLDGPLAFELDALVSNANYVSKRTILVLFINGRPVDCQPLRRAIEGVYSTLLPKNNKPFIFMDLRLPPRRVEVNVHPTKREVGFLHQEEVIEAIREAVHDKLLASSDSRRFTQLALPFATQDLATPSEPLEKAQPYYRPDKLVRTDHRAQSIEGFLVTRGSLPQETSMEGVQVTPGGVAAEELPSEKEVGDTPLVGTINKDKLAVNAALGGVVRRKRAPSQREVIRLTGLSDPLNASGSQGGSGPRVVRQRRNPAEPSDLTSIRELLQEVERESHPGLVSTVQDHVLVGVTDHPVAFLQHRTQLFLVDPVRLTHDLFYQQTINRFNHFDRIQLQPPLPLYDLMMMAMDLEEAAGRWKPEDGDKEEISQLVCQLVSQHSTMLSEYFSIDITGDHLLASLPVLVDQYIPPLNYLPDFILALGRDVNWKEEKSCFRGIAQALADLYAIRAELLRDKSSTSNTAQGHPGVPEGAECGGTSKGSLGSVENIPNNPTAMAEVAGDGPADAAPTGKQLAEEGPVTHQGPPGDSGCPDYNWTLKHVLFPAMKVFLRPSRSRATDGTVILVTSLEKLYRVFERC